MTVQTPLTLAPLRNEMIPGALALDHQTLGGRWTASGYRAEIAREQSICLGLLTPSHQLIGMGITWVVLDEAHIILMAIESDWQCRGLGCVILSRLLLLAIAQKGCTRATLEVKSSNQPAIRLYQKFQFQALGKRPNYYGIGHDAIIFWKNQLQSDGYCSLLAEKCLKNHDRLQKTGIQLVDHTTDVNHQEGTSSS